MAATNAGRRVGGTIYIQVGGRTINAKGSWEWNIGLPNRSAVVGSDRTHGFKEEQQVAYIAGAITVTADLDIKELLSLAGVTVTLRIPSGHTIALYDAWRAGDGTGSTEEGELEIRFEGMRGEVV